VLNREACRIRATTRSLSRGSADSRTTLNSRTREQTGQASFDAPMSALLLIPAGRGKQFCSRSCNLFSDQRARRYFQLAVTASVRFLSRREESLTRAFREFSAVTQNPRVPGRKSRACTGHNKQPLYARLMHRVQCGSAASLSLSLSLCVPLTRTRDC